MSKVFLKSQLSSFLATAVDFSVSFLLSGMFGVWYILATTAGQIAGATVNFWVARNWVFVSKEAGVFNQLSRYALVWAGNAVLNVWGTYIATDVFGLSFFLSKTVVAVTVAVVYNYIFQKEFVFRTSNV